MIGVRDFNETIQSVGIVRELGFPKENRICFQFAPSGATLALPAKGMPPPNTFRVQADRWMSVFIHKKLSAADATVAAEFLTRYGYVRFIRTDPFRANVQWVSSFTVQGGTHPVITGRIVERIAGNRK